jgi:hypothetical protein
VRITIWQKGIGIEEANNMSNETFEEWRKSLEAKPGDKILTNHGELIADEEKWRWVECEPNIFLTFAKFLRRKVGLPSPDQKGWDMCQESYELLSTWTAPVKRKHEFTIHKNASSYCIYCDANKLTTRSDSECPGKPEEKKESAIDAFIDIWEEILVRHGWGYTMTKAFADAIKADIFKALGKK